MTLRNNKEGGRRKKEMEGTWVSEGNCMREGGRQGGRKGGKEEKTDHLSHRAHHKLS